VIAAAFAGTFAGDQLFFFLGRRGGMAALETRPRWKARSVRVFRVLREHELAVILGFRFVYGFRTVTPFLLGASGVPALRFIALNAAGAALWAACFGTLGYFLGRTLEVLLGEIKRFEVGILVTVALVGSAAWLVARLREPGGAGR
jgi:membrane protein DedA with SNARE-associated domain